MTRTDERDGGYREVFRPFFIITNRDDMQER